MSDVVTPLREKTGETKTKHTKWEGTCYSCARRSKRGFCKAAGTWAAHVNVPQLYCNRWRKAK